MKRSRILSSDFEWTWVGPKQELGEGVGTSQSVIARAESGRHSFQIDLLRRIAEAADATCHLVFIPREGDDQSIISLANVPKSKASAYHVVVDADEQAGAPIQPLTANAGG